MSRGTDGELRSDVAGALILGGAHGSLAIARSLGRRGIPVWLVTHDHPLTSFSRYTKRTLSWDGPDDQGAANYLIELSHRHGLEGWVLFACGDAEVRLVSQHHAELSRIFRITTLPWEVTQVAYDKTLTYRHAETVGIGYPRSYHPCNRADVAQLSCRFPVVLKPAFRKHANAFTMAKGWKAVDHADLLAQYDRAASLVSHDEIVLQEFVPGTGSNQLSYAAIWDRGAPVASLVARRTRQYPIEFGLTSTFVETIENARVEIAAVQFLRSLNYSGIVELEFKYDDRDDSYKLLDFNARAWTWIGLGASAGIDFPHLLWKTAIGDRPEQVRGKTGAAWMHVPRDLMAGFHHTLAGTLTPSSYLRSLRFPTTFAAFALDDPLPGILELPVSLYRAATKRVPLVVKASNGLRSAVSGTRQALLRNG
jgi:D-aspartate ligase